MRPSGAAGDPSPLRERPSPRRRRRFSRGQSCRAGAASAVNDIGANVAVAAGAAAISLLSPPGCRFHPSAASSPPTVWLPSSSLSVASSSPPGRRWRCAGKIFRPALLLALELHSGLMSSLRYRHHMVAVASPLPSTSIILPHEFASSGRHRRGSPP